MQKSALSATACAVFKRIYPIFLLIFLAAGGSAPLFAQGGEAALKLPDLHSALFLGAVTGPTLLMFGLGISALGFVFGIAMYMHLRNLPVHESMLEISELIYETCKTYLITQGKFLLILEIFIGAVIALYFGLLTRHAGDARGDHSGLQRHRDLRKLRRGLVRHSREHLRQLAHGVRQPARQTVSLLRDSVAGRHEHRHAADQRGTVPDAVHPVVHSGRLCRAVLYRIRHRRVSGRGGAARGRRNLHQDRRHRRGPDEDRFQDQRRRRAQPRRDCGLHRR